MQTTAFKRVFFMYKCVNQEKLNVEVKLQFSF